MKPNLPKELHAPLRSYLSLLDHWNRVHALTALPATDRWEELVLDSAALLPHIQHLPPGSRLGDFGTGMGMPAILLALAFPDIQVLALDKSKKKLAFVHQAALELGLKNIQIVHGRFESIPPLGLSAGVAKALAPLPELRRWWERHGLVGASFYALKGQEPLKEEVPPGWLFRETPYELPSRGNRRVLEMRRGA